MAIVNLLAKNFKHIQPYLIQADMKISLEEHIQRSLVSALFLAIALTLVVFLAFLRKFDIILIPLFIVFYFFGLYLFINYPYVVARRRAKEIDNELLFAGKHLLISLKSGVPLFVAIGGLTKGYGELSKEMKKIVDLVSIGVPLHTAMKQVAEQTPSTSLRRMLMQLVNSLLFGSEVTNACQAIVDEIAKDMELEVKEYGQKLTPIVLGFLILGIIFPAISVAFAIVISTLIGGIIKLNEITLIVFFIIIAMFQYVFLNIMKNQRPRVI
ncbi:MAG: type II secretion system F family protein [Candidatus Anstonellales archaeon]